MNHTFYFDGDAKKISWLIQTGKSVAEQSRIHVAMYKDKVTTIQSKYIAMHVGLFWGIGVFIIKKEDHIRIMIDEETMYEQLTSNLQIDGELTVKKIQFIKQIIAQRKLEIKFEMISKKANLINGKIHTNQSDGKLANT